MRGLLKIFDMRKGMGQGHTGKVWVFCCSYVHCLEYIYICIEHIAFPLQILIQYLSHGLVETFELHLTVSFSF